MQELRTKSLKPTKECPMNWCKVPVNGPLGLSNESGNLKLFALFLETIEPVCPVDHILEIIPFIETGLLHVANTFVKSTILHQ
jgi:hypothetical protein